ncbi:glycerophosphodiester phosphodiesterase [Alkanindiges hydrocarboniclasticus]|uniref:glycerophosphodiester phosphodiesterase n=1 Tax=Alkanindiges hydrocarboniclasticus TaxID=1907941 RepID=A0A1S8CY04_9GAMM|nr:glycerophosphodiester phosphodiesterase [Alkanindiges hydrocarboniclasticus]ONG42079.1 glycerophosphodiester phosphodiesterase [Alkanindiges hydrocarboniclasticus]
MMFNKQKMIGAVIGSILATTLAGCNDDNDNSSDAPAVINPTPKKALVYGHRGAAGYLPDHTLQGYKKGMELGADFVEPDLVMTKDGILVCRHEPNIGGTTNVAAHPEFASRKTSKMVDGVMVKDDWFVSDFTLSELKTLRAIQPIPQDRSTEFDGQFEIPTFEEMIATVQAENKRLGKTVGIIPEIKHSTFHASIFGQHKIEDEVLRILAKNGYNKKESPVIIQSFEVSNLKYLNGKTDVRLVQLIDGAANLDGTTKYVIPYDLVAQGITTEKPLNTAEGLVAAAKYADIIGPWKNYIVGGKAVDKNNDGKADDVNGDGLVDERDRTLSAPTDFIKHAHAAGLQVVPYTFRNEPRRLASDYKGDPKAEYKKFYDLGVDGVFTDFVDTAVAARDGK